MTLKIKNWHQFQHFKDRKPPWIKLYRDLLDDIVWHQISGEDAKTLVMLWLIASENDGILPEFHELAFRLRTTQKSIKSTVSRLSHWLIQDDINPISDITVISERYQNDALETETETEREKETKNATPEGVSISVWKDFLKIRKAKKSPMTETALKGIEAEAIKAGITLSKALEHCCTRGWAGFKASWLDGEKTAYTAQITVPGRQGVDPALAKAIADGLKATAPSAEIREKINQLRKSA